MDLAQGWFRGAKKLFQRLPRFTLTPISGPLALTLASRVGLNVLLLLGERVIGRFGALTTDDLHLSGATDQSSLPTSCRCWCDEVRRCQQGRGVQRRLDEFLVIRFDLQVFESGGVLGCGLFLRRGEKRPVSLARRLSLGHNSKISLHFARIGKKSLDLGQFFRLTLVHGNLRLLTNGSLHGRLRRLSITTDTSLLVRMVKVGVLGSLTFGRFGLLVLLQDFGENSRRERVINKRLFFVYESGDDLPHVIHLGKGF